MEELKKVEQDAMEALEDARRDVSRLESELLTMLASSSPKFRPKTLTQNSGLKFQPQMPAQNSDPKFRPKILAQNSGPKFRPQA